MILACVLVTASALLAACSAKRQEESLASDEPRQEDADISEEEEEKASLEEVFEAPETVLTVMIEGMEEKIPAKLSGGKGYTILIPEKGFVMSAADCWRAEENEDVRLMVFCYEGKSLTQVEEDLTAEGYTAGEKPLTFQKKLPDGLLQCQLLKEDDQDVWGVSYCYPDEPEYTEGFGTRLFAMASSLEILEDREAFGGGLSSDAKEVETVVKAFSDAYFKGDKETLEKYLTVPYEWDIETRESEETVSKVKIKGLELIPESEEGDVCHVFVEFLDSPESDAFFHLSVDMVKQSEGWKVSFYGLEG